MERPQAEWLIEFLEKAGKLKSVPRHCITPEGVRETVAGHCWRVSLMAWLLKEELPDVDMEKVIHMCLLHDLGEAVTGDIPAFEKKGTGSQRGAKSRGRTAFDASGQNR
jgi:putative hydrolase of HD superfamily